jgi:hypothetical protein
MQIAARHAGETGMEPGVEKLPFNRGAEDTAAVCAVLEKMAGVKRGKSKKRRARRV